MSREIISTLCFILIVSLGIAGEFSWQKPHAEVLPTGDLKWKPEPFEFVKGDSVRYIDYEGGNDSADGKSKETPWKHHPWDKNATGNAAECKGIHTYIFKQGVIYRGSLYPSESGEQGNPIRLTRDPSWGEGEAGVYGSESVKGWKQGADNKDIPEAGKVWYADIDFAPRRVCVVDGEGKITEMKLARTPNWEVTDPDDIKSGWWKWQQPGWWKDSNNKTNINGRKMHLGVDRVNLTKDADYYVGGMVWTEWGIMMGTPYPTKIEAYDSEKKTIAFQGPWSNDSYKIITRCRYYIEDKPHYLDQAGEYWFHKKGGGGRLYLRLPEDADPNSVSVEAASRIHFIESKGMSHVHISGLTFRFGNLFWDITARTFVHPDILGAVVRVLGPGKDIVVRNCTFEYVPKAVRFKAVGDNDVLDSVVIADNEINHTDHGAINAANGSRWGKSDQPMGKLKHVDILRNKLYKIGYRAPRPNDNHALTVTFPDSAEIAGNILHRTYAAGLFIFGGKGSGQIFDSPFTRILIHHNKVTDSLLNSNDWGGIETWQGGTMFVYNNISGNPGGVMNWRWKRGKPGSSRFGHAYYLDGGFKNFHFNNIAWGKNNDVNSLYCNTSAFQEIHSYQNTFFHNTAFRFFKGTRRQAAVAGRNKFLGNVWQDMSGWVFWHAQDKDGAPDPNAHHAGKAADKYHYETNAYDKNIFFDIKGQLGVFEATGKKHSDIESFSEALKVHKALASGTGTMADASPLADPDKGDFRLSQESPGVGSGVKVFVPWTLYDEVGEWHFTRNNQDPTRIIDEHWNMAAYFVGRDHYHGQPMYPLTGTGITADSYENGALEDWAPGGLNLDGENTFLTLSHKKISEPIEYKVSLRKNNKKVNETRKAEGKGLKTVDMFDNNFLIEVYFSTEDADGLIAGKMDSTGYTLELKGGKPVLTLKKDGAVLVTATADTSASDGAWTHLIAEVDREKGITLYINGKKTASETGQSKSASLSNNADFTVGKDLKMKIDFLRVSRGTLADAETTIEELYEWQFNGPQFHDFAGVKRGNKPDAGALELVN